MKTDFQNFVLDARIAILGMSVKRREAINRVIAYRERIAEHLVLIAAYPEAQEQRHWRKELSAFGKAISRSIKLSRVELSVSFVTDLLYQVDLGLPSDRLIYLEWAQSKMNRPPDLKRYVAFDFRKAINNLVIDSESIYKA